MAETVSLEEVRCCLESIGSKLKEENLSPNAMQSPRRMPRPLDIGNSCTGSWFGSPRALRRPGWSAPTTNDSSIANGVEKSWDELMSRTGYLNLQGKTYKASIEDLVYIRDIGSGTYGQVQQMKFVKTGSLIAVKQLRRTGNVTEDKRVFMDLQVVLNSNECPYIVKCFGCFVKQSEVWICMELMSTCIEKLLKLLKGPIPEKIIGKMTVAILRALNYLKEKQYIMHRDVKPSNFLLDQSGNVKLCDFGISGRLVDSKAQTRSAGCVAYLAPERIDLSASSYDTRADVWSLGLSLIEMATGDFPYETCTTDFEVMTRVLQEPPPRLPPTHEFSLDFIHFVECCLQKKIAYRWKYRQLLMHEFIHRYDTQAVDVASWFNSVIASSPS